MQRLFSNDRQANMLYAAVTIAALVDKDPLAVLKEVTQYYKELQSFEVTIDHENTSGLFPGNYQQNLKWQKGNFELIVTKPSTEKLHEHGRRAPDYFMKDGTIVSISEDRRDSETYTPDPNSTPGWQVSGGNVMSILYNAPFWTMILNNDFPAGFSIKWSFGKTTSFNGTECREIVGEMTNQGRARKSSIFVGKNPPLILGETSPEFNRAPLKRVYRDYKINPKLPATLGAPPK